MAQLRVEGAEILEELIRMAACHEEQFASCTRQAAAAQTVQGHHHLEFNWHMAAPPIWVRKRWIRYVVAGPGLVLDTVNDALEHCVRHPKVSLVRTYPSHSIVRNT